MNKAASFSAMDLQLCASNFAYSVTKKPNPRGHEINQSYWSMDYHFTDTGGLRVGDNAQMFLRKKNTLCLYPPALRYCEYTFAENIPGAMAYIVFNGESSALRQLINNRLNFAIFDDKELKLEQLFKEIHQQSVSGTLRSSIFHKLFFEIIHILINESCKTGEFTFQTGGVGESFFSQKVNDYLQKNIDKKISVSIMAKDLGVSVSTMTHKYQLEADCSPMQYLMQLRIDLAKTMLLKGVSLAQIAFMTGFYDEYHLSKSFKKQVGLSPKKYKNSGSQPNHIQ